jgi:CMP-N-acetylneuraminic acid synthetase
VRIVALVPSRLNSIRIPSKNIKELGNVPLVNYTLKTLNKIDAINEIFIYASEPSIIEHIGKGLKYTYLERPSYLDSDETPIQDIIREFLKKVDADIIVLWHITSPFLKAETIKECLDRVQSGEYDSSFTAFEVKGFCWYEGRPLNYDLDKPTPKTRNLHHVIVEQSALYIFKREIFEKGNRRIGQKPFIKYINHLEGHDIDTEEAFAIAEMILESNLFHLY